MKKMYQYWLCCLFLIQTTVAESPVVQTPLGPVQGNTQTTSHNTEYYAFEGIPYAKPPVGKLRFKAPEPVEPWKNTLIATEGTSMCPQMTFETFLGKEDCLHLNVFTPKISSVNGLPVMMFIHGGGFKLGSGSVYFAGGPQYLMDKEVVLVTINYRLGALGFLSTGDAHAPGNYGLLDQVQALKWIQQNIRSFGGNPNKVTIFGESAGSGCVHYHLLSPLSAGLFHSAISQSGTAVAPWAYTRLANGKAKLLAEKLGCPDDSSEMIACLQKVDFTKLVVASQPEPSQAWNLLPLLWLPRVDIESTSPFLPQYPNELLNSGNFNRVPWMVGVNRDEGLFFVPPSPFLKDGEDSVLYKDWNKICRMVLRGEEFNMSEHDCNVVCQKIREYYVSEDKLQDLYDQGYIDVFSAFFFSSPMRKSIELSSQYHPVYMYSFEFFSGRASYIGFLGKNKEIGKRGVNHADELLYLFNLPIPEMEEKPESDMIELMTTLWTNFAKTGVPTFPADQDVKWPMSTAPDYKYASLNLKSVIKSNYRKKEMSFWENIFKNNWYKDAIILKDEL